MRVAHVLLIAILLNGCTGLPTTEAGEQKIDWPMIYHIPLKPTRIDDGSNRAQVPNSIDASMDEFDRMLPAEMKSALKSAFLSERALTEKSRDAVADIYFDSFIEAVKGLVPAPEREATEAFPALTHQKVAEFSYLDFVNRIVEMWALNSQSPLTASFRKAGISSGHDILRVLFRIYGARLNGVAADVDSLIKEEREAREE